MSVYAHSPATLKHAHQHCQQIASGHYENFPTASKLIRADLRPAVAAIYAFARTADDIADEGNASIAQRLLQLEAWEEQLEHCFEHKSEHPIFIALQDSLERFDLPAQPLRDLLTAFRMDCTIQRYATEQELLFYCKHSANPVGRLMLALHGIQDRHAVHASNCTCTALQLTNFWQDLSIDHPKGRCYLPESWLNPHGFSGTALIEGHIALEQAQPAITHAFEFTHQLYQEGLSLLAMLPFRLRLQISATWHGGMTILRASERTPNPLIERPQLKRMDWLSMVPRTLRDTLHPKKIATKG